MADANYGIRWLKSQAREWNGDPETVGALGVRAGATCWNCAPCARTILVTRCIRCQRRHTSTRPWLTVVARSPISDPVARYEQAQKMQRASLITNSETYFNPWDTIVDANPQRILERGEPVTLPPMFVLQGELDDNVLPAVQERFVATYRAAGGEIDYEVFPGAEHRWIIQPGLPDRPRHRDDQGLYRSPVARATAGGVSVIFSTTLMTSNWEMSTPQMTANRDASTRRTVPCLLHVQHRD